MITNLFVSRDCIGVLQARFLQRLDGAAEMDTGAVAAQAETEFSDLPG